MYSFSPRNIRGLKLFTNYPSTWFSRRTAGQNSRDNSQENPGWPCDWLFCISQSNGPAMSEEKPGQYLTIRQDKNPGAFGKWSIPGLEQSFEFEGAGGIGQAVLAGRNRPGHDA